MHRHMNIKFTKYPLIIKHIIKYVSHPGNHKNQKLVDSTLSWKIHNEQITHKVSTACYAVRSVKPSMSQETMKMVYLPIFIILQITMLGELFTWCKSF